MTIINTDLTTVAANIFAPTSNSVVVTLYLCNTSSGTVTANIYAIPVAGTANATTQIACNLSISAYDTYIMSTERLVIDDGEALVANANANSAVSATVSYTSEV